MEVPVITLWTGILLSLPLPTSQSCFTGLARDCKKAEFVPGSGLAGEGFDISKMQRKGAFVIDMSQWEGKNGTCTMCKNPFLEGKMQKLPTSVVDWRPSPKCSMNVASSLYQSSESLVSSSTSTVENNWKADLAVDTPTTDGKLMLAGSHSKLAEYSMAKTKKDKFSFTSHKMSCSYYSYRVSSQATIHPEFQHAVNQLPKEYTSKYKKRFYKLIDTYGTHYMTKVVLGGTVHSVTSIRECQASLEGLSSEEIKMCLEVEAAASVGNNKAKFGAEVKHCDELREKTEAKMSFSSKYSDRITEIFGGHTTEAELLFSADKDPAAYREWLSSLPLSPEVISYSLEPLHELLPTNMSARKHLRKAISHYILERGFYRNCSAPCTSGTKRNPKEPCVCSCHNGPGVNRDCCPTKRGMAQVTVTVERAAGLWGDTTTATDAFVKLYNSHRTLIGQTSVIWNNNWPHWDRTFDFEVVLSQTKSVAFEVWDEDNKWDDDLLGTCNVQLTSGTKRDLCQLDHGQLFYKLEVTCGPSLSGPSCSEYVSSPMNSNLEKMYVSRHARPIPQQMLAQMGVLTD